MSHRFPTNEAVFPPLQLSESAKANLNNTASRQLTLALRDYDTYRTWQASRPSNVRYQLHPGMWKPIKTCEQVTVYRKLPVDNAVGTAPAERSRRRARSRTLETMRVKRTLDSVCSARTDSVTDFSRSEGRTRDQEWNMPTLLQIGTIEGTLDDVMYSSVSFDALGTLVQSSYTTKDVLDAETLYELQGPTANEPFRFRGIKWVVKSTLSTVKALLWPRDLLLLVATGTLNRFGGDRVGYHLMHSVDLGSGFGPLDEKRIVRGRVSSCYLYRQKSPTTVDVYMTTNFDSNGSVHESVALLSAATSLTHCITSSRCAQNQKLSWLLAHPTTHESEAGAARSNHVRTKLRHGCAVCTRFIGAFSRCFVCRVCNGRVCSICSVKKKLSFPGIAARKMVAQRSVVICTHCLTYARKLNALEIAAQEVQERQLGNRQRGCMQGEQVGSRNIRSTSRPEGHRQRRGTLAKRTATSDNERVLLNDTDQTSKQFNVQDSNSKDSEVVLLPLASEPSKSCTMGTKTQSTSKKTSKLASLSKSDALSVGTNIADHDYVGQGSVDMSMQPEVPVLEDSLPEAVVQYAWRAAGPSPTSNKHFEPLPLPPSSAARVPTKTENSWPDQRAVPHMLQPKTFPRIDAGASTQEVLAQFAELCNVAEHVFQTARKQTITHSAPTVRQQNTSLDMSAVD